MRKSKTIEVEQPPETCCEWCGDELFDCEECEKPFEELDEVVYCYMDKDHHRQHLCAKCAAKFKKKRSKKNVDPKRRKVN